MAFTAPVLVEGRNALNEKYPDRDHGADGFVGDASHKAQGLSSEHNARAVVNGVAVNRLDYANGVILAGDYDTDPIPSREEALAIAERIASQAGVKYVNYGFRRSYGNGWVESGPDGYDHIHVSLENDAIYVVWDWNSILDLPAGAIGGTAPDLDAGWNGWDGNPANWPLGAGHYFGPKSGPGESHGGFYPDERPAVALIQRSLIGGGYVPGVGQGQGWDDGVWEQPTTDAVLAWQAANGLPPSGVIGLGDWNVMFATGGQSPSPVPPAPSRPEFAPAVDALPYPFGGSDYFGDINGPKESHGGWNEGEKPYVAAIQRRLQELKWASSGDPSWADGVYGQPTIDAVMAWQRERAARVEGFAMTDDGWGRVYSDDYAALFGPDNWINY